MLTLTKPQVHSLPSSNFHVNLDLRNPHSSFKFHEPTLDKEKIPGIISFKTDFALDISDCCLLHSIFSIRQAGRGEYQMEYKPNSNLLGRDRCLLQNYSSGQKETERILNCIPDRFPVLSEKRISVDNYPSAVLSHFSRVI